MTDWNAYWQENTFEINRRVNVVRDLLKIGTQGQPYTRYGTPNDGGYVMCSDIYPGSDCLVSMGVERNVDFEVDLAKRIKNIHMYDYSVATLPKPVPGGKFFQEKIGLGHGETSVDDCVRRMRDEAKGDLLLKMDIEGSEWNVLSVATRLNEFRQITVEMHWMMYLGDDAFYEKVVKALSNLRKTHTPVLVHANNNQPLMVMGACPVPNVFEVLYLRTADYHWDPIKDPFASYVVTNDPTFPEIGLSFP
jgi:hypothetical protein